MTDRTATPPDWSAVAASAAAALGLAGPLARMPAADWERLRDSIDRDFAERGAPLPPGWHENLARAAGRPGAAELTRDEADAVLAEKGEVFAPEDDA